jgi:hypothetical protein
MASESPPLLTDHPSQEAGTQPQDRFTYAYLLSAPHSGSTLIACLLGAHPQVSTVGEIGTDFNPNDPWTEWCGCGHRYVDCPFWKRWGKAAQAEGIDFELGKLNVGIRPSVDGGLFEKIYYYYFAAKVPAWIRDHLYGPLTPWDKRARGRLDKSIRLVQLLCRMEQTRVFFDSTKNPYQARFLSQRSDIKLKLIWLIRDGRGVLNSLIKRHNYVPLVAVRGWMWHNRLAERIIGTYVNPSDVFRLRLEDLCKDVEGTRHALFRFLGVDENVVLDYTDRNHYHLLGNDMRTQFNGTVRSDESWRQELAPENLALFQRLGAPMNAYLGYT